MVQIILMLRDLAARILDRNSLAWLLIRTQKLFCETKNVEPRQLGEASGGQGRTAGELIEGFASGVDRAKVDPLMKPKTEAPCMGG
jgi:hypothetical protein